MNVTETEFIEKTWLDLVTSAGFRPLNPSPFGFGSKDGEEKKLFVLSGLVSAVEHHVRENGLLRNSGETKFQARLSTPGGEGAVMDERGLFVFGEAGIHAMTDMVYILDEMVQRVSCREPEVNIFMPESEEKDELVQFLLKRGLDVGLSDTPIPDFYFQIELDGEIIGAGGRRGDFTKTPKGPGIPTLQGLLNDAALYRIITAEAMAMGKLPGPMVLVAYMDEGVHSEAQHIAIDLRDLDIPTECMYKAKNVGRQMKEASDLDVDIVVVVGGEEWDRGEVEVRDFRTRERRIAPKSLAADAVVRMMGDRIGRKGEDEEEET